jgi:LytS/YehU family sensor histidine kinase
MSLEKMQYEERLDVRFHIAPEAAQCKIPPMVIQMLAENAVKHGISKQSQPGMVQINVTKPDETLTISIINSGMLDSAESEGGIGIANIKNRLSNVADGRWAFSLNQIDDSHVESKIEIPCHTHQKQNN